MTLSLHIPTLLMVQASFSVLCAVILGLTTFAPHAGMAQKHWAWGCLWVSVGMITGHLNDQPLWLHAVLSYTASTGGMMLMYTGMCHYLAHPPRPWLMLLLFLNTALPFYFAYIDPSILGRRISTTPILLWTIMATQTMLWRHGKHLPGFTRHFVQASLMVLLLAQFSRVFALWSFEVGLRYNDAHYQLVWAGVIFFSMLALVSLCCGLVMMMSLQHSAQLQAEGQQDALTGVFNRRALEILGQRLLARAAQLDEPLALAIVDADHFKRINDTHGHLVGDDILRHLAQTLRSLLRPMDLVARYGGEEFVLLIHGADDAAIVDMAERLRERVEQSPYRSPSGQMVPYTVSIGVSTTERDGYHMTRLLGSADAALYHAKRTGRNRVCHASSAPDSSRPSRVATEYVI